MRKELSLEEFLKRNRIDNTEWDAANIEWETLQEIATDHINASANLEKSAEFIAKVIQKFNDVHSVRWRVKNPEHLLAKIIRKRVEGNEKYADISVYNYFEKITDLVGVRALHLFKDDCFGIDKGIRAEWNIQDPPLAYIREGDSEALRNKFSEAGFEVRNHDAGYRSVHYLVESTPLKRKIMVKSKICCKFASLGSLTFRS